MITGKDRARMVELENEVADLRRRLAACGIVRTTWENAAIDRRRERDDARKLAAKLRAQLERPGGYWEKFPWE